MPCRFISSVYRLRARSSACRLNFNEKLIQTALFTPGPFDFHRAFFIPRRTSTQHGNELQLEVLSVPVLDRTDRGLESFPLGHALLSPRYNAGFEHPCDARRVYCQYDGAENRE